MNISKAFAGEFVNQNSFRFSIQISTIECKYMSVYKWDDRSSNLSIVIVIFEFVL